MKILVDENIPTKTVSALRDQGHDVVDIRGTTDQGMNDQDLWQKTVQEQRLCLLQRTKALLNTGMSSITGF